MNNYKILFVCTANLIRSPIAEALLKNYLSRIAPDTNWQIESAGIRVDNFREMPDLVKKLLDKRGIPGENHVSRSISSDLIKKFDLILVMELRQKEALQNEFPNKSHNIFMLSEMSNLKIDVRDPSKVNLEEIIRCIDEIDQWILNGIPSILDRINYLP